MNRTSRRVLVACVGVMLILLLTTCSLSSNDAEPVGYVQVSLTPPARMIVVTEYEVERLWLEVFDDWGPIWETEWWSGDGPQSWTIPVYSEGEHWLEVHHYGWFEGEEFEAAEGSPFEILPGLITRISVTPGAIGVVEIGEAGGPCEPPELPPPSNPLVYGTWGGDVQMQVGYDPPEIWNLWVELYFDEFGYAEMRVYESQGGYGPIGDFSVSGIYTADDFTITGFWCNWWDEGLQDWVIGCCVDDQWYVPITIDGDYWPVEVDFDGDGIPDLNWDLWRLY